MDIVFFHSILGLRPIEHKLASVFERNGYNVILPDLFDGKTAPSYDEGFKLRKSIETSVILKRANEAIGKASPQAVLGGISFGASMVGEFWHKRPEMSGAMLIAGVAPWHPQVRKDLPCSIHIARPDPFDDESFFSEWSAEAQNLDLQWHRYDGGGHLFFDSELEDYNDSAAELFFSNCSKFLKSFSKS